jgi:hypothetical protein
VPGNIEASEALYRVSLPPDDDAFMPAEGKTPLTAEQVAILRWWVGAAAPRDTTVAAVGVPADVEPLLAAELGLGGAAASTAPAATETTAADPALVERLASAGLLARPVSQSDSRLVVSPSSPGTPLGAPALAAVAAARESIVDLNLAGAALDDAGLEAIGALPAATHLRLSRNALTDAGIASLDAPRLEHLNLYGNAGVTDSSVDALASIATLREIYLWQTGVSPAGAARLRERRPDLAVDTGAPAPSP